MQYQIKLDMNMDANSLNTLLGALGSGPHNFVRPIIDSILQQAKEQEDADRAKKSEEITEQITEAGLTD
jgi:hypothetical protein